MVNSDNETGRKESGKAGDSPEEPPKKVVGEAKYTKPSPKRKALKQKKKSRKRRLSTSSGSEYEETEMKKKKKEKMLRAKKENKVTFLIIKCFKPVTPQQIWHQMRNQRHQLTL